MIQSLNNLLDDPDGQSIHIPYISHVTIFLIMLIDLQLLWEGDLTLDIFVRSIYAPSGETQHAASFLCFRSQVQPVY